MTIKGIDALTFWLNRHPADLDQRYTIEFIIESAKLILENNHFKFRNTCSHFKQILGTAMGTKFEQTYASLVLGFIEITMYQQILSKYEKSHTEVINKEFKRYFDDCFIVWNDTWGDVIELTEHIDTDIITFVTTHNPNNVNMFIFLQINKEILNNCPRCKDVFKNTFFYEQQIFSCESVFSKFRIA